MLAQGYVCETSPLGNVYYLPDGVTVTGDISINYMEYPWITCFEVSGLLFHVPETARLCITLCFLHFCISCSDCLSVHPTVLSAYRFLYLFIQLS